MARRTSTVTLLDVARESGVSRSTVSRVLSGRKDEFISAATAERVTRVASELGYRRNIIAKALITGRTNTIGILAGDMNSFQIAYLRVLQRLLANDGYNVLTLNDAPYSKMAKHIQADSFPADGFICVDVSRNAQTPLDGLFAPTVFLGTLYDPDSDYVRIDTTSAMSDAIRHLSRTGRKTIGLFCEQAVGPIHLYVESFFACAKAHGVATQVIEMRAVCDDRREYGRRSIAEHARSHGIPDAIVFVDDDTAIGAYRGLLDIGIRVPDDVALIGCDGIRDTEYLECPLSTMQTPFEEMCAIGWGYLKNRIENPSIPLQQKTFSARLILRKSSEPAGNSPNCL